MVIESNQELEYFLEQISKSDTFIIPIYKNDKRHPANNDLSLLYVGVMESHEEFMLVFDHGEKFHDVYNLDIIEKLDTEHKIFSLDKKSLLHLFEFKNVFDVNLMYYFGTGEPMDYDVNNKTYNFFNRMYHDRDDINCIIPILKHQEVCSIQDYKSILQMNKFGDILKSDVYKTYNKIVVENFYKVEKSGLYYDYPVFNQFFKDKGDFHKSDNPYLYTNYNLFTATGRPSNSYGGINFAALKKDNGERALIRSRHKCNGILVEMDYDAFHIRLIADLVGFSFPKNINVHEYFGQQYFGKDTLTEQEYEDSKNLTFQLLYGGISKEFQAIPFYKVVDKYIYNIWNEVKVSGYIKSKIFGRTIVTTNNNFTRQKLFNYVIQLYETERNQIVISNILNYLSDKKTKMILYTYDSFLFDFDLREGKIIIDDLKKISSEGNYPVSISYGKDYNSMKKLK